MNRRAFFIPGLFLLTALTATACEVCGAGQPEIIRDYTHGKSPSGPWDYVIVLSVVLGTISVLPHACKCLVRPGETARSHIKHLIINPEEHGD